MAVAKNIEELIVWRLAVELRDEIFKLTEDGAGARDRDFKEQIRKSARSSAANLAEGFGAFYPGEFARFGRIARRSMIETRNHLYDARKHAYFAPADSRRLIHLTFRAQKATTRLVKYLDSCKHRRGPAGWTLPGDDASRTGERP